MKNIKRIFFSLSLLFILFFLDRYSKIWAISNLANNQTINLGPFLNLNLIFNRGIIFGIFGSKSTLTFALLSILIISVSIFFGSYLIWRFKKNLNIVAEILVISGAISNLLDRFKYNGVIDFIDLHIKAYHWPTFNVADIFIFIGLSWIIFREMKAGFNE